MDSKGAAVSEPTQEYEDFVPESELVQEEDHDTLLIHLSGFKKQQVRVQLTSTGILKISGQRPVGNNKWIRFMKEYPLPENCDKAKISAKFDALILYIKLPKLIISSEKNDPKTPSDEPQQAQKKPEEPQAAAKSEKTTLRDEFAKKANAEETDQAKETEKEEPKITSSKTDHEQTEAKDLPGKPTAEQSSTIEDGKATSFYSKSENEAKNGLPAKLKVSRKVVNMTLVALLVLGIGLYVSNIMKSNNQIEE